MAIECICSLLEKVVTPLAIRSGLSWPETNIWHIIKKKSEDGSLSETYFTAQNPF